LASALAPPHPSFEEYENVHQMRKRLNITYDYEPRNFGHEHCRFLSEAECADRDEVYDEAKSRRRLNPSTGTLKVLLMLGYYPEHKGDLATFPDVAYFDELYNGVGTSAINEAGSVAQWLRYNGLTEYDVTFVVQDWEQIGSSEATYAGGNYGRNGIATMAEIAESVMEVLDGKGFDFSPYDSNGDGKLDGVVMITSGYPAELGPDTCAPEAIDRIWSQATPACNACTFTTTSGHTLDGYMLASAWTLPLCAPTPTTMGIHAHGKSNTTITLPPWKVYNHKL
jgi:hypothetical protein